ncbi:uncharacterized protein LOC121416767 isoform X4 [Lytechinus variegatus]|uniref:uncharacterized protein LOC121416767 isoform X4 n=1 Tax=Lytechinus variegatus TaxID=7654 RepID=UPI001BB27F88|nr:uncharacterized protein LOC121416767 isoform X4 [Lytechinus variegatus]
MRMEMEKKDRSSVTEEEFLRLAQLIPPRYYSDLGIHLGISSAELDHIIVQHSSDYKDALMTMFTRWRDEQHPDGDIRALLAEGLEKSDLGGLSKELLAGNLIQKTTDVSQETVSSRASTSTGAADVSALSHTISERELLMLSTEIGPNYYKKVGINLNISFVTLDKIKKDTQDTTDALMTVFTRWRDKQLPDTNIRAHLAEALYHSDLGFLSHKLITGNLLTKSKGTPVTIPVSETKPLTPDLIKRCTDELQDKYRTDFCMIRADPLDPDSIVPFEDMYTSLFLEKEKRSKRNQLEYKDLFNLRVNGVFPKRIMIQGEAGAGKTTFLAKIAWDWINDSPDLSKFVWVLIIPLREAKRYTIGQIVKSYLSKDNPATACQITEYIRSNPEKVFIACDGLDEFSGKVVQHSETKQGSEGAQSESNDQTDRKSESQMSNKREQSFDQGTNRKKSRLEEGKQPWVMQHFPSGTSRSADQTTVGSDTSPSSISIHQRTNPKSSVNSMERGDITVEDILCSDELHTCPVMVTSRPWKANEIRWNDSLRRLYTFIHVEGFSRENAKVYIRNYFKDTEATADEFIQLFENNDIISENMAPYPIYISMLCHMWRELDDNKKEELKSFQTFSEIFREVFEFLKVRYVQKEIPDLSSPLFNTYRSEIEKLLKPISKVAFTGLQSNNLIFNEEDLEQYSDSVETACKVGVLSQENKLSSIHDKSSRYLQSTFFFPHKLFQEYMAAVYLASLYDSDRNEFKRLIEEVVIPRKEEFRYLLYFTVSQNKNIAKYTTKCLLQQYTQSQGQTEMNFLVDVAFESQDEDTNAMLRNSVSSLSIHVEDTHTIAGYASTGIYSKAIIMSVGDFGSPCCGPGISKEVAVMICSAPSLRDVKLKARFHPTFYETLAREGRKAAVHTLEIENNEPLSSVSSHHLVGALCSLPNLTNLTLRGDCDQEEFCSHLNKKASTLKVHTLEIENDEPLSSASSHHLVGAVCSLPNLTNLTLRGVCDQEEFYSHLNEKASTLKVHTLEIDNYEPLSSASSHHLADALCSLPNLTNLTLRGGCYQEEFCSHLNEKASTLKVHTLEIWNDEPLSSASSHHIAEALCSLPNLTNLTLRGVCDQEEFYSHLNEKASTLKGSFPQISKGNFIFNFMPQKDLQSFLQAVSDEIRLKSKEAHYYQERPKESEVSTETISEDFPTHQDDPNPAVKREQSEQNETQTQTTEEDHTDDEEYDLINLEKYGITVKISKHEIYGAKDITVEVIEEVPPELELKETEPIISVGLKMSPSDAIFDSPVIVTMPHCGIFTKPEQAEVFIYYRHNGSTRFKAIHSTSTSNPRCIVRDYDLDIFLDHFSEFWIGGVIGRLFHGKRLYCTPCIPVPALRNEDHMVYVHVRDASIKESEILKGYEAPISEEEFQVWWGWGGLEITFKESPTEKRKILENFYYVKKEKVMFELETRSFSRNKVLLHFILKQWTRKELIVPMTLSAEDPTSASNMPPVNNPSSSSSIPHPVTLETTADSRAPMEESVMDFDDILREIAKQVNKRQDVDDLGCKLGFRPSEIESYFENNRNASYMGTLQMLRDWRKRTLEAEELELLRNALIDIRFIRLADELLVDGKQKCRKQGQEDSKPLYPKRAGPRKSSPPPLKKTKFK